MSTHTKGRWGISFPDNVEAIAPERVNILALSGGGYRGLFGAHVLSKMEARFGTSCKDNFQIFAGTSIGGIVACALAVGIPAKTVYESFKENGEKIFPKKWLSFRRGFFAVKYSPVALKRVVEEILGAHSNIPLKNIKVPLLLPTVCINDSTATVLKSGGLAFDEFSSDVSLLEAAMATSAAPTYLPSRLVGNRTLVDGGLVANAPDVVAIAEAVRSVCKLENTYMLSIGTCGRPPRKGLGGSIAAGKLSWIIKHNLVGLTFDTQEQLAVETVGLLLREKYLRIDAEASTEERAVLGLDKAGPAATKMLDALAVRAVGQLTQQQSQRLDDFFHFKPMF
ncbi:CBASS cGAMP-activated phospholipase [uncultured Xanthomonas sp.]|uniref:CBASS cGAMP-activated phospholipase n=1 Tax=uncultured Xanthomonas sp. TaxID=152831 RepID=UPI0037479BCE